MNLKKAIEIKERQREGYTTFLPEQIDEADRLLIEAGKRIQEGRRSFIPHIVAPLLGETKD